jgi:hypothetical protein
MGSWPFSPKAPSPYEPALCAPSIPHGKPAALLKRHISPRFWCLMSSGSKKKEPKWACLIEAKASHGQKMWAEVSSSAPHCLHSGLSINPIKWRCLHRVLCPVRSPVTTLDCSLLKDKNFALASRWGPDINSRACRWEQPRSRCRLWCWFASQRLILLLRSRFETPKSRLRPYKHTGQATPRKPISCFIASHPLHAQGPNKVPQHAWQRYHLAPPDIGEPMGDVVLTAPRDFRAARLSEQILMCFSGVLWFFISWAQAKMANTMAWKTVAYLPRGRLSLLPTGCPYTPALVSTPAHPGPICESGVPLDTGRSPSTCGPILPGQCRNTINMEITYNYNHVGCQFIWGEMWHDTKFFDYSVSVFGMWCVRCGLVLRCECVTF